MPTVFCPECGITAYSKCPHCRTVFPGTQMEARLSAVLKHNLKDGKLTVVYMADTGSTEEEALRQLYSTLQKCDQSPQPGTYQTYPSLKVLSCQHEWVFRKGETSSIGCGHSHENLFAHKDSPYWDCECDTDWIRKHEETECPRCNSKRCDLPDNPRRR